MIKRLGFAFGALFALSLGAAPMAAQAQDKSAAKPAKTIDKDQRARGLKEAPAAVQNAGVACTVTDGYYLGESTQKTPAGKEYKASIIEAACKEGLGYMIVTGPPGEKATAYDCLATQDNASLACRLPANADPKQGLAPLLAAAGDPCTVKEARYVGSSPSGQTFYEVACQEGDGYVLQTTTGAAPKGTACLETADTNLACKLTTKSASIAPIARLAAQSGKPCQVSDARFVGASATTGERYYEVACGAQPGFVIETDAKGAFKVAVNCGAASGIGGGCKMTDSTQAQTQEAGTYTGLAKAGGFNCDVTKYRVIGMLAQPKSEVVELACSNRPDGTVALFPDQAGAKAKFVDCIRGAQYGANGACELTSLTPIYAKYSAALAARGRSSCKVTGARWLGHSPENTDYIETACADGNPGWVIEFTPSDSVKTLLSCGQAKSAGLSCKLPTNTKS